MKVVIPPFQLPIPYVSQPGRGQTHLGEACQGTSGSGVNSGLGHQENSAGAAEAEAKAHFGSDAGRQEDSYCQKRCDASTDVISPSGCPASSSGIGQWPQEAS